MSGMNRSTFSGERPTSAGRLRMSPSNNHMTLGLDDDGGHNDRTTGGHPDSGGHRRPGRAGGYSEQQLAMMMPPYQYQQPQRSRSSRPGSAISRSVPAPAPSWAGVPSQNEGEAPMPSTISSPPYRPQTPAEARMLSMLEGEQRARAQLIEMAEQNSPFRPFSAGYAGRPDLPQAAQRPYSALLRRAAPSMPTQVKKFKYPNHEEEEEERKRQEEEERNKKRAATEEEEKQRRKEREKAIVNGPLGGLYVDGVDGISGLEPVKNPNALGVEVREVFDVGAGQGRVVLGGEDADHVGLQDAEGGGTPSLGGGGGAGDGVSGAPPRDEVAKDMGSQFSLGDEVAKDMGSQFSLVDGGGDEEKVKDAHGGYDARPRDCEVSPLDRGARGSYEICGDGDVSGGLQEGVDQDASRGAGAGGAEEDKLESHAEGGAIPLQVGGMTTSNIEAGPARAIPLQVGGMTTSNIEAGPATNRSTESVDVREMVSMLLVGDWQRPRYLEYSPVPAHRIVRGGGEATRPVQVFAQGYEHSAGNGGFEALVPAVPHAHVSGHVAAVGGPGGQAASSGGPATLQAAEVAGSTPSQAGPATLQAAEVAGSTPSQAGPATLQAAEVAGSTPSPLAFAQPIERAAQGDVVGQRGGDVGRTVADDGSGSGAHNLVDGAVEGSRRQSSVKVMSIPGEVVSGGVVEHRAGAAGGAGGALESGDAPEASRGERAERGMGGVRFTGRVRGRGRGRVAGSGRGGATRGSTAGTLSMPPTTALPGGGASHTSSAGLSEGMPACSRGDADAQGGGLDPSSEEGGSQPVAVAGVAEPAMLDASEEPRMPANSSSQGSEPDTPTGGPQPDIPLGGQQPVSAPELDVAERRRSMITMGTFIQQAEDVLGQVDDEKAKQGGQEGNGGTGGDVSENAAVHHDGLPRGVQIGDEKGREEEEEEEEEETQTGYEVGVTDLGVQEHVGGVGDSVVAVEGDGPRSVVENGFEPLPVTTGESRPVTTGESRPVTAGESRPVTADTEERGGSPPNPPEDTLDLKKVDPAHQTERIDAQGHGNVSGGDAIVDGRVEEGGQLPRLQKLMEESDREVERDGRTYGDGESLPGEGIESTGGQYESIGNTGRASSSMQLMVRAKSVKELEKEINVGRERRRNAEPSTETWPKWRPPFLLLPILEATNMIYALDFLLPSSTFGAPPITAAGTGVEGIPIWRILVDIGLWALLLVGACLNGVDLMHTHQGLARRHYQTRAVAPKFWPLRMLFLAWSRLRRWARKFAARKDFLPWIPLTSWFVIVVEGAEMASALVGINWGFSTRSVRFLLPFGWRLVRELPACQAFLNGFKGLLTVWCFTIVSLLSISASATATYRGAYLQRCMWDSGPLQGVLVSAPSSPYGIMCGPYYPCLEGQYCGEAGHEMHLFAGQVDPFGTLWETMVTILQISLGSRGDRVAQIMLDAASVPAWVGFCLCVSATLLTYFLPFCMAVAVFSRSFPLSYPTGIGLVGSLALVLPAALCFSGIWVQSNLGDFSQGFTLSCHLASGARGWSNPSFDWMHLRVCSIWGIVCIQITMPLVISAVQSELHQWSDARPKRSNRIWPFGGESGVWVGEGSDAGEEEVERDPAPSLDGDGGGHRYQDFAAAARHGSVLGPLLHDAHGDVGLAIGDAGPSDVEVVRTTSHSSNFSVEAAASHEFGSPKAQRYGSNMGLWVGDRDVAADVEAFESLANRSVTSRASSPSTRGDLCSFGAEPEVDLEKLGLDVNTPGWGWKFWPGGDGSPPEKKNFMSLRGFKSTMTNLFHDTASTMNTMKNAIKLPMPAFQSSLGSSAFPSGRRKQSPKNLEAGGASPAGGLVGFASHGGLNDVGEGAQQDSRRIVPFSKMFKQGSNLLVWRSPNQSPLAALSPSKNAFTGPPQAQERRRRKKRWQDLHVLESPAWGDGIWGRKLALSNMMPLILWGDTAALLSAFAVCLLPPGNNFDLEWADAALSYSANSHISIVSCFVIATGLLLELVYPRPPRTLIWWARVIIDTVVLLLVLTTSMRMTRETLASPLIGGGALRAWFMTRITSIFEGSSELEGLCARFQGCLFPVLFSASSLAVFITIIGFSSSYYYSAPALGDGFRLSDDGWLAPKIVDGVGIWGGDAARVVEAMWWVANGGYDDGQHIEMTWLTSLVSVFGGLLCIQGGVLGSIVFSFKGRLAADERRRLLDFLTPLSFSTYFALFVPTSKTSRQTRLRVSSAHFRALSSVMSAVGFAVTIVWNGGEPPFFVEVLLAAALALEVAVQFSGYGVAYMFIGVGAMFDTITAVTMILGCFSRWGYTSSIEAFAAFVPLARAFRGLRFLKCGLYLGEGYAFIRALVSNTRNPFVPCIAIVAFFAFAAATVPSLGLSRGGSALGYSTASNFESISNAIGGLYWSLIAGGQFAGAVVDMSLRPPECTDGLDCPTPGWGRGLIYSFRVVFFWLVPGVVSGMLVESYRLSRGEGQTLHSIWRKSTERLAENWKDSDDSRQGRLRILKVKEVLHKSGLNGLENKMIRTVLQITVRNRKVDAPADEVVDERVTFQEVASAFDNAHASSPANTLMLNTVIIVDFLRFVVEARRMQRVKIHLRHIQEEQQQRAKTRQYSIAAMEVDDEKTEEQMALEAAKEAAEQRRMILEKRLEMRRLAKAFQSTAGTEEAPKRRQNQSNHWRIVQTRAVLNQYHDAHLKDDASEAVDLRDVGKKGSGGGGVEKGKGSTLSSKVRAMNLVFGMRRTGNRGK